jgi:hypothetical protein
MPDGNWRHRHALIVLGMAFATVVALAATQSWSPKGGGEGQQQQRTEQASTNPRTPSDGPLVESDSASELNAPCAPGEENRNSDLCAQWKAADAADESAEWAERMSLPIWLGAITGVLTLLAAVAAAVFAKSAAYHTKRSADAAVEVNESTKRAEKLANEAVIECKCTGKISEDGVTLNFTLTNAGKTTADNIKLTIYGKATLNNSMGELDVGRISPRIFSEKLHSSMGTGTEIVQFPINAKIGEWLKIIKPRPGGDFSGYFKISVLLSYDTEYNERITIDFDMSEKVRSYDNPPSFVFHGNAPESVGRRPEKRREKLI